MPNGPGFTFPDRRRSAWDCGRRTSCRAARPACGTFERYCPCGTPEEIAAALQPYADAGCRSFNLIPVADSEQAAIEGADAVRTALRKGA